MRLDSRSTNDFIKQLNQKNEEIQKIFLSKMIELTKMIEIKVMMGDSTITEQKTFDPKQVSDYFQNINSNLKDWSLHDVSVSNHEDIRRIFTKFEIMEGNYLISGHISLQFHMLLYYKPDQSVLDCQKEFSEIVDFTKNNEEQIYGDRGRVG